jgi:hypothetical protein
VGRIWSSPVSNTEAARRAGGRRRHNALRHDRAMLRRARIVEEWKHTTMFGGPNMFAYGGKVRLARELGVSRATITRDLAFIRTAWGRLPCPTCGSQVDMRHWRELERDRKVKVGGGSGGD